MLQEIEHGHLLLAGSGFLPRLTPAFRILTRYSKAACLILTRYSKTASVLLTRYREAAPIFLPRYCKTAACLLLAGYCKAFPILTGCLHTACPRKTVSSVLAGHRKTAAVLSKA